MQGTPGSIQLCIIIMHNLWLLFLFSVHHTSRTTTRELRVFPLLCKEKKKEEKKLQLIFCGLTCALECRFDPGEYLEKWVW